MENLLHGVASDRVVVAHGLLELDKNDSVGVLTLAPRYTTIEEECQSKAGPATRLRYMTQRLCPMRRSERTRDGHRAATGYDHQLRDVVNLTVHNNGPLAVFAIVLDLLQAQFLLNWLGWLPIQSQPRSSLKRIS